MATNNKRKTTSSSSRGRKKPAKKQAAPIRREVGACVCLVLALCTVLGCLGIKGALLSLLIGLFKRLIGSGLYILPFSFVMGFLILLLHDGRPVALRVTCSFLLAVTSIRSASSSITTTICGIVSNSPLELASLL